MAAGSWKVFPLPRLDEHDRLEDFIDSPRPTGHRHEGDAALEQQHLSYEEAINGQADVEVAVERLLMWEDDAATDAACVDVAGTAVGGLHEARVSAGYDRDSYTTDAPSQVAGRVVVGVAFHASAEPKMATQGPTTWTRRKPRTSLRARLMAPRNFFQRERGPVTEVRSMWLEGRDIWSGHSGGSLTGAASPRTIGEEVER